LYEEELRMIKESQKKLEEMMNGVSETQNDTNAPSKLIPVGKIAKKSSLKECVFYIVICQKYTPTDCCFFVRRFCPLGCSLENIFFNFPLFFVRGDKKIQTDSSLM